VLKKIYPWLLEGLKVLKLTNLEKENFLTMDNKHLVYIVTRLS